MLLLAVPLFNYQLRPIGPNPPFLGIPSFSNPTAELVNNL